MFSILYTSTDNEGNNMKSKEPNAKKSSYDNFVACLTSDTGITKRVTLKAYDIVSAYEQAMEILDAYKETRGLHVFEIDRFGKPVFNSEV